MVVVTNEPFGETEPLCWSPIRKGAPEDVTNQEMEKTPTVEHAYRNITSSMQADPLEISSPRLALDLLSTAVRLQNMPLVKQCIEIIDQQIDPTILLQIMIRLSECTSQMRNNFEPSAPPIIESEGEGASDKTIDWVEHLVDNLRHNCLLEIDKHAESILRDPDFQKLQYIDVLRITTRDTLEISNELLIYTSVMKWANSECRRRTLQPHLLNIKAVLRELVYAPRYGLMTKKEFQSRKIDGEIGPTRSGILDEREWRKILFYIKEKSKNRPVEELPRKCSMPRRKGEGIPKQLSTKSNRRFSEECREKNYCTTSNRCDKIFFYFVACWSAVFD